MIELANLIYCKLFGNEVGKDIQGNVFYESGKLSRYFRRYMRWVYYNGIVEPTKISPEWYSWLHHQTSQIPSDGKKNYKWEKSRQANLTGTELAYYPPGHILSLKQESESIGDYHAWQTRK